MRLLRHFVEQQKKLDEPIYKTKVIFGSCELKDIGWGMDSRGLFKLTEYIERDKEGNIISKKLVDSGLRIKYD